MEKDKEEISLEDLIEKERANLDTTKLTKVKYMIQHYDFCFILSIYTAIQGGGQFFSITW